MFESWDRRYIPNGNWKRSNWKGMKVNLWIETEIRLTPDKPYDPESQQWLAGRRHSYWEEAPYRPKPNDDHIVWPNRKISSSVLSVKKFWWKITYKACTQLSQFSFLRVDKGWNPNRIRKKIYPPRDFWKTVSETFNFPIIFFKRFEVDEFELSSFHVCSSAPTFI